MVPLEVAFSSAVFIGFSNGFSTTFSTVLGWQVSIVLVFLVTCTKVLLLLLDITAIVGVAVVVITVGVGVDTVGDSIGASGAVSSESTKAA